MINLDNSFRVALPVEQTWEVLTDLPRVAECLPGAHLSDVVDGEYRGGLAARIGPITVRYQGVASFVERDDVAHRAVISARGREEKGGGSASASITAALVPDGTDATQVRMTTSLAISGRASQFGRSLIAEVSTTMLDQFAQHLEAMISAGEQAPKASPDLNGGPSHALHLGEIPSGPPGRPDRVGSRAPELDHAISLGPTIVIPILRRVVAPLAGAVFGALIVLLMGAKRRGSDRERMLSDLLAQADARRRTG